MYEIQGKYTNAKIFANTVEDEALNQIKKICDMPIFKDAKIRVMPDVHAGKGSVIGFTATYSNYVIPNIIGVDIGCGVAGVIFQTNYNIDFDAFEQTVVENIPLGKNRRNSEQLPFPENFDEEIELAKKIGYENNIVLQCGTLGGGNHYIEIGKSRNGQFVLSVHSGSRHFGWSVANYFQEKAKKYCESKNYTVEKDLEFLEGKDAEEYLEAMRIAQNFAKKNRRQMINILVEKLKELLPDFKFVKYIESVHNYIDLHNKIIRKGAIDAGKNVDIILPLNMKEGVVIGIGKGNPDWNYSAPHGAGRLRGRIASFSTLSMKEYAEQMKGVYSKSVCPLTLDEAPNAYKNTSEILEALPNTMEITGRFYTVYNRKAIEQVNKKTMKKLQENLKRDNWGETFEFEI